MVKVKEELVLDQNHVYRFLPSGTIVPGVSEIINTVFPFEGRGEVADRAALFGEAVHRAVELSIKGVLDWGTVDPVLIPYLSQWDSVVSKLDILKTQCQTEIKLYSKRYKFSGKVDVIEEYIIDLKTGQPHPRHRLQIAAYRHLCQINNKVKMPKGLIVYLDGSDKFPQIIEEKPSDFNTFLALLEIYNFKKGNNL